MKNKEVTKQVVGIDIGKDNFYACYKIKNTDDRVVIKGTKSFENNALGIKSFYTWCQCPSLK